MGFTEKFFGDLLPSTEFEHQALLITVPNVSKETVSPQSSFSIFHNKTTSFTEVKKSFPGSNSFLNDEMKIQESSSSAPSNFKNDSKISQKENKISEPDSSKSRNRKHKTLTNLGFLTSSIMPPTLRTKSKRN